MTNLLCSSSAQLVTSPALRQSSCRGFCGVTDNDAFVGDSCQCVQSVPGSSSGWQGEGRKQHFHLVPDPLHIQDFIFKVNCSDLEAYVSVVCESGCIQMEDFTVVSLFPHLHNKL